MAASLDPHRRAGPEGGDHRCYVRRPAYPVYCVYDDEAIEGSEN